MTARWSYVVDEAPKPYVHPLVAPGGQVLTTVSPPDHLWHRGLWFAIKYVDGVNFWEEEAPFGTQHEVAPGRLEWRRPDGAVALLEERSVAEVELARADGAWALDWTSALTAPSGATLDRTPYTTWGGYSGLTLRGAREWADTRIVLADGSEHRRPEGVPAAWCDISSEAAGVTICDHPGNRRHPVPWYGATRSRVYGEGWGNFVNAAFLFHDAMTLAAGEQLTLRYRVIVHGGGWTPSDASAEWHRWVEG